MSPILPKTGVPYDNRGYHPAARTYDRRYEHAKLGAHTQRSHIYSCKRFAAFLKQSPETATSEDIREEIDRWRSLEADKPSRSKAIRPLIRFGLAAANEELVEYIDHWRSSEPDNPSRSDAIQCLIMMALSSADREKKQAGSDKK